MVGLWWEVLLWCVGGEGSEAAVVVVGEVRPMVWCVLVVGDVGGGTTCGWDGLRDGVLGEGEDVVCVVGVATEGVTSVGVECGGVVVQGVVVGGLVVCSCGVTGAGVVWWAAGPSMASSTGSTSRACSRLSAATEVRILK